MQDHVETDFFTDLSLIDDPYPYLESLRAHGPVVQLPKHNVIAVVGFEEGCSVHRDTDHYSAVNAVVGPLPPLPFIPEGDDITAQIEAHRGSIPYGEEILTQDQPRLSALRSLLSRLFTPRRLREMETYLTALSDRLIDDIPSDGKCEFLTAYSQPYATLAIADLLGVPDKDRDKFRSTLGGAPSQVGDENAQQQEQASPLNFDDFLEYVEGRRRAPRDDIMSELANAHFPDGTLPEALEVVRLATILFGAGQDTTATLLGSALRILAEDSQLQQTLREDASLIPGFIEEVLRMSGPVKSTFRLARKPVSLGGLDVTPGTTIMLSTAAMNRDPRRFDDPETFQIDRPSAMEHLAFGRGAHTCPGAALARTEARISLERLLSRFASIRIDEAFHGPSDDRRFNYQPTYLFRGLTALHLQFDRAQ